MSDIKYFRTDYGQQELNRADLPTNPMTLFEGWLVEAMDAIAKDANAFTLATLSADGSPSARVVLLKEVCAEGFTFFTNYQSQKGQEMERNSQVSMNFFWPDLERQVRISGLVEKVSNSVSDAYFNSRPYESQIGAWASEQSTAILSRSELEEQFTSLSTKYQKKVPRPPHWGGYLVKPQKMEFWQGRSSRLHDRFRFTLEDGEWMVDRLAP